MGNVKIYLITFLASPYISYLSSSSFIKCFIRFIILKLYIKYKVIGIIHKVIFYIFNYTFYTN